MGNNENLIENRDLAFELLRVHQNIIDRKEKLAFTLKNWLFTLVTGTIIAFLSGKMSTPPFNIILISTITIFLFYVMEVCNRAPSILSQGRVEEILLYLANEQTTYPISLIYRRKELIKAHLNLLIQSRIWVPYLSLELILLTTVNNGI